MTAGAAIGGWCGDRWGRKATLIGSMLFFGVPTLLIAGCGSLTQMTALRILSGIGFGAALPNATALVAEYMPTRLRAQAIALVVVGTPLLARVGSRAGLFVLLSPGVVATLSLGVWLAYLSFSHRVVNAIPVMFALSVAGASNVGAQAGLYALAAMVSGQLSVSLETAPILARGHAGAFTKRSCEVCLRRKV
jgi:AAHS family 4-hydroxybenzoate transporter-like MFS transporter